MRTISLISFLITIFALGIPAQNKTENVILITVDGLRWQEMFGGLDEELFRQIDEDATETKVFKRFSAKNPRERREKLMPFFWQVLMKKHGSIAGNPALNSSVQTTNKMLVSYPGYSEIFTGEARDELITNNDKVQNKFPSFFQFVQKRAKLNFDQVASFASWDVMNEIVSSDPDAFIINAGFEAYKSKDAKIRRLSKMQFQTPTPWDNGRHDFYTFQLAIAHLKKYKPRVIHIGFGETDRWAHKKRYDRMLQSTRRVDGFLNELWSFLQTNKNYRNKTSIIITTDHGRGRTKSDWYSHRKDIPEARNIWMAFISPDSKLRGAWKNSDPVYLNQVAATLCKYLGYNYLKQNPNAGKPIERIFSR